jgi:hypothetical protein
MTPSDQLWLTEVFADWEFAEAHELKLTRKPLPTIVLFDDHCQYQSSTATAGHISWIGVRYEGKVLLPDGSEVPNGVTSFAAPLNGNSAVGFLVMSLPSVWRSHNIQSELWLERLLNVVLLHGLSHTQQFPFVNPKMSVVDRLTPEWQQLVFAPKPHFAESLLKTATR